jgi:hypothetical protein
MRAAREEESRRSRNNYEQTVIQEVVGWDEHGAHSREARFKAYAAPATVTGDDFEYLATDF